MIPALAAAMFLLYGSPAPTAAPGAPKPAAMTQAKAGRILVVPFESATKDGRAYWLGEAVALLLTDDINARGLGAITRPIRERAYEQLHLPPTGVLSRATVIRVGEIVGAAQVIVGDVSVEGDALTVRARQIRIDVGRADSEILERGTLADLFTIVRTVARRAVPGGVETASAPPPSLQAFERFVKGLLAEQPAAQAEFLEAAIKQEPGYDRARLALWDVRTAQGEYAAALAVARSVPASSPYARRARFLAGVSLLSLKQNDEAFTVFKDLQAENPAATVLNNLGVAQLRRNAPPDTGKPVYFFTKAAELSPDDPDVLFNLGYAYAVDRDPQGALYWLREALRRDPTDAEAHFVLAFALEAAGNAVEATRERELAAQLSSDYADLTRRELPRGRARVEQALESWRADGIDQAIVTTTQRDQREQAQYHLERGRRLYESEQDREAAGELRRAIFLSPYEAEAHLLLGRIHLRGGRTAEAIAALTISIWSRDTAAAQTALADAYLRLKDLPNARLHAQKALALDPSSTEARTLLEKIERGGQLARH